MSEPERLGLPDVDAAHPLGQHRAYRVEQRALVHALELGFKLEPLGSGSTEELSISQCKAVFIHLQANQSPKDVQGRSLTVTFGDSRSVQGVSDDYQPGAPVFTLVPPTGRGQFERIIVNGAAVRSVG